MLHRRQRPRAPHEADYIDRPRQERAGPTRLGIYADAVRCAKELAVACVTCVQRPPGHPHGVWSAFYVAPYRSCWRRQRSGKRMRPQNFTAPQRGTMSLRSVLRAFGHAHCCLRSLYVDPSAPSVCHGCTCLSVTRMHLHAASPSLLRRGVEV
jgi:hypothetical protein